MPARRLELSEFLRFPSQWTEQLPASGRPLTAPMTVGVPTVTTTTTITTHPVMASAIGIAFVATRVLLSANAPLLIVAMLSAYTRLTYSPYVGHALRARPASVRPIHEAVRQPIRADSVRVYPETYGSQDGHAGAVRQRVSDGHCEHVILYGRRAGVGDHMVGAEGDGYTGAVERYKHTVCGSLYAGDHVAGTIGRTHAAGAVGQPVSNGCYEHTGWSSYRAL